LICRGLPHVLNSRSYDRLLSDLKIVNGLASNDKIGPQLSLGGIFGDFDLLDRCVAGPFCFQVSIYCDSGCNDRTGRSDVVDNLLMAPKADFGCAVVLLGGRRHLLVSGVPNNQTNLRSENDEKYDPNHKTPNRNAPAYKSWGVSLVGSILWPPC
jgi:hypothetical protein